ncbi:MAG: YceD family protein [Nitrospiraceae bacterium]
MTDSPDARQGGGGVQLGIAMNLLTPKIADITAEGLSLSGDLTGEELGLTDAGVSIQGTLAVGLDLRAVERTICVTGVVEGTAVRQCVRCLKEFDEPMTFSLRVAYEREMKTAPAAAKREDPRRKKTTAAVEVEPEEQNDDLYYYAGDHLELAPMLREQVILVSPMHPLCGEQCLGLCARCGKDLNEGPCHCAAEEGSKPFHALRSAKQMPGDQRDR